MAVDLDDLFPYTTVKMVKIRDRYLGFLHYAFMLAIFIYIVIFVVVVNKGYLNYEEPVGTIRLSLKRIDPTVIGDASNSAYCGINGVGTPITIDNNGTQVTARCRTLDVLDHVHPDVESSAMFIATRITESTQTRTCTNNQISCAADIFRTDDIAAYYPTDVEKLSLKIQHSVQAPTWSEGNDKAAFFGTSETMRGKIYINGVKETIPPGDSDIFLLSKLLASANVNLDAVSDVDPIKSNSYRYDGIVLVISMKYYNDWGVFAPAAHIRYDYTVTRLKKTEFKVERVLSTSNDGNTRIYQNMHGIRLIFVQTGQLGKADFQVLLVQLVSALALLAVATTIVDQIAIRLMPHRAEYSAAKFETTEDFSDLRDKLKAMEAQKAQEETEMQNISQAGPAVAGDESDTPPPATPSRAPPPAPVTPGISAAPPPGENNQV